MWIRSWSRLWGTKKVDKEIKLLNTQKWRQRFNTSRKLAKSYKKALRKPLFVCVFGPITPVGHFVKTRMDDPTWGDTGRIPFQMTHVEAPVTPSASWCTGSGKVVDGSVWAILGYSTIAEKLWVSGRTGIRDLGHSTLLRVSSHHRLIGILWSLIFMRLSHLV